MPITEWQNERRRRCIGASDVGALFGADPFKSESDVYYSKVYGVVTEAGRAAEAGNTLEVGLLNYAAKRLGKIRRNQRRRAPKGIPITVNLDALLVDRPKQEPIDGKTSGLFGPLQDEWGPDGSDEVPARIVYQLHAQMLCTGADQSHVVALLGGRGFVCYCVQRDRGLMAEIVGRVQDFWHGNVLAQVPPPGQPAMETLRALPREVGKAIDLDAAASDEARRLLAVMDEARNAEARAKFEHLAAKRELVAMMDDTEALILDGGQTITYQETKRAGYTVQPTTYRQLRGHKPCQN